ncbi:unnamed protein product [Fraxinus pennsylvanica]|uniref:Small ribosomal subunit protein mS23 n=1 Tax=Fraxinus pennsylvanica TaxID=56036 RepID=A0AAD1Z9Y4_9LAMI|nr:unnamed protein product [Fraxinus pennsylvanica]
MRVKLKIYTKEVPLRKVWRKPAATTVNATSTTASPSHKENEYVKLSHPNWTLGENSRSAMSYMRGDLLSKTRKLVKGLAKSEPVWLKAMEKAPPATFPRAENKLKPISLPEDVYISKFFQKHPDSKHEDTIK